MALLHMDGFDGYATTAQLQMRYSANGGPVFSTTLGRFGGGAFQNGFLGKAISGSPSTIITGAAFQIAPQANKDLIWIRNGSGVQLTFCYNTVAGTLQLWRGAINTGTLLGSFAPPLWGVYSFIELKCTIHSSAGSAEVRFNGATVLNLTGINTQNQATADITRVDIDNYSGTYVDDWYILDTTGSAPLNTFLGDIRITTLRPSADSSVAWTRSTGSTNAAAVDDTTVDATDYVSSSTVGQRDIYDLGDLTGSPTVYAVMATAWGLKTDAGTRGVKVGIRYSGNETQSSDTAMTTTTSPYTLTGQSQAPGAVAWTSTVVNATQLTLELSS